MKRVLVVALGIGFLSSMPIAKAQNTEGLLLFKTNCYACHNPSAPSHDAIVAPPMAAIKHRYSREFQSKNAFVEAIINFTTEPSPEKARMKGALRRFNVMPKPVTSEADIRKIAAYIYENDIEEPEWFAEHFRQKHNRKGKTNNSRD